jgi:predicted nuclease of predicted toxin-antitoxin system
VKLLIDSCLSHVLAAALRAEGHDVESVADWPVDPGDRKVLAAAVRDGRVLVSADREFGELAVFERLASAGLIILVKIPAAEHFEACRRAIAEHCDTLESAGTVVVQREKMRARSRTPDA